MDTLSPDTSLALMQTSQANVAQAGEKVKAKGNINVDKIEKVAEDFEAVFIAEMMKPMFEGIKHDGMFGGGKGEEIFHGMLVQEYGKVMSQTGSVGIAEDIKAAMIQMQADANNLSPEETQSLIQSTNGEQNATTRSQ